MRKHVSYHQCYLEWDGVGALVWVTYWLEFQCETAKVFAWAGKG